MIADDLVGAVQRARWLRRRTVGLGFFDPAYPFHGAVHECPFCGDLYRVHGGFADHRDRCEEGPSPGSNPAAWVGDEQ